MKNAATCALIVFVTCSLAVADTVRVTTYSNLRSAVLNAPASGRTVVVAPGTYYQNGAAIWVSGKPNLTIRGETGNPADVVIVGRGINNSGQHHNVWIGNSPNFTIENVTLRDSYYHAVSVNDASHYAVMRNCIMWDNGESGVKATHAHNNPDARYSDYGIVENCRIGFTTYGQRGVIEGVDLIATKGWIIRDNVFVNVRGQSSIAYGCFPKGNALDSIIENNLFYNCDIAASFGGGGTGLSFFRDGDSTYEHRNGIIRNNIMIGGRDAAVYLNKSLNAKVYNNLAYKHGLSFQARFPQTSATFRNNIDVRGSLYPSEPVVRWRDGAANLGSSHNVRGDDSWFVAPAVSESADFHLVETAGAIDAGFALPDDVPTDMDGVARPQGSAWDLGPYEYEVQVNQWPTVSAGGNLTVYEGRLVVLQATADDPDDDPLQYMWLQGTGKPVALAGADTAEASFTAPVVTSLPEATLTFYVTVDDGLGGYAFDEVTVRVYMTGDINRDDSVDVIDLLMLAGAWNTTQNDPNWDPRCDLNDDGAVNVMDLLLLANNWTRALN